MTRASKSNTPRRSRRLRQRWEMAKLTWWTTAAARLLLVAILIAGFWFLGHPLPHPDALMLWIVDKWKWLKY